MRRFIQCVCLILVLSTCLAVPAAAAEEISPWASNFFLSHGGYLWWTSSTEFQVWFDVAAIGTMDEIGVSEIKVQCSSDSTNWETVATYGKMVATNTGVHGDYVTYSNAVSGNSYRAKITFYAKKGTGWAEYTYYAY